ncbi:MAG: hypothetical protein Q8N52_05350 [Acidobacteriota bacterium]|nr:hypothetical protein [Acidobacteriota bacterium]
MAVPVEAPAPSAETPAPAAAADDYLVVVGLFADLNRADWLVQELTQAGLRRLRQLGGYDDATVVNTVATAASVTF